MRPYLPLVLTALCPLLAGADWPQWRGPSFNGSTVETSLPEKWTQSENIAWKAELPGPSAGTPVIAQDRVFLPGTDKSSDSLLAMCYDRKTGELLWQHTIAKGVQQDYRSNYASCSPATDGEVVVFFYGNGDLVTFDLDGQKLWDTNLGPFAFQWTFASSPLLYDGKLYLQILQRNVPVRGRGRRGDNPSYLLALDPRTGKEIFRHERPSKAVVESLEAYSTPLPLELNGRRELVVVGGDAITGHNPETGEELWRWGTWNPSRIPHWRLVPSPVEGDGVLLACAPKGDPVYAVRTGGKGEMSDDDALVWVSKREQNAISSDVPTPAFYDDDFFILNKDRRILSRVVPKTGEVKWSTSLPGREKYEASPLAGDGKIYVMNFDGEVSVVDAESGDVTVTIPMEPALDNEDKVRSSIVAAHGQLFIRTNTRLYCVGAQ